MIKCENDGLVWLNFELLSQFPRLKHGVFLRHGGKSNEEFSSLNISYSVGDSDAAVTENRNRIQKILSLKHMVSGLQVHGKEIQEVTLNSLEKKRTCDGLMTSIPDIGIMVTHADCQAAIFYDPENHALANVHSGWRGSVQNIYRQTIEMMKKRYGTLPGNLHVAISPSLGPEKAEFVNYRTELPEQFWDFRGEKNLFDFWEISRQQLIACGVLDHHIAIAGICTYSHPEDYFSYRRSKVSGRHGTVASLSR